MKLVSWRYFLSTSVCMKKALFHLRFIMTILLLTVFILHNFKVLFHCLLIFFSDKIIAAILIVFSVPLFNDCFECFYIVTHFEKFDYHVPYCDFHHWSSLDLWVYSFHQIWFFWSYFYRYFFCIYVITYCYVTKYSKILQQKTIHTLYLILSVGQESKYSVAGCLELWGSGEIAVRCWPEATQKIRFQAHSRLLAALVPCQADLSTGLSHNMASGFPREKRPKGE